eukprot:15449466-Alexandrium_andersonii.AAC.1
MESIAPFVEPEPPNRVQGSSLFFGSNRHPSCSGQGRDNNDTPEYVCIVRLRQPQRKHGTRVALHVGRPRAEQNSAQSPLIIQRTPKIGRAPDFPERYVSLLHHPNPLWRCVGHWPRAKHFNAHATNEKHTCNEHHPRHPHLHISRRRNRIKGCRVPRERLIRVMPTKESPRPPWLVAESLTPSMYNPKGSFGRGSSTKGPVQTKGWVR